MQPLILDTPYGYNYANSTDIELKFGLTFVPNTYANKTGNGHHSKLTMENTKMFLIMNVWYIAA